jgi:hypothetical protein
MVSKTLTTIAASVIVFGGFLAIGGMISKGYLARRAYNYKCRQADTKIEKLADLDNSGELDKREWCAVYMGVRGQPRRPGDSGLNMEEKEKWLSNRGYFWNEKSRDYIKREPVKPEPYSIGTPKDKKCLKPPYKSGNKRR